MPRTPIKPGPADTRRWVRGQLFGLDIPADLASLQSKGPEFLTAAFRAAGTLAPGNSVSRIVEATEFEAGGTGKKCLLAVEYDAPEPALPVTMFVKFSRNFDNELWDSARYLMVSEATFAVLSSTPDFPVPVPTMMFADVDSESGTGLLITECIDYGQGEVEPRYFKCMDYAVPDQVGHYQAILRGLARLSGAHRAGRLPAAVEEKFPYDTAKSSGAFGTDLPEAKILERAVRLFDFIDSYPQLFPANVRTQEFRQQFVADIPDVLAAGGTIRAILYGDPNLIAFAHWNANIDNCWFTRDAAGHLTCGFLDWANAGQLSVAQSITGAISGAETVIWDDHLDDLLGMYVEELAANGGPSLSVDVLRLHTLLIVASGLPYLMGAPLAIARETDNIAALESSQDPWFAAHENARIQLHMTTRMLNVWQTRRLGDLVRGL